LENVSKNGDWKFWVRLLKRQEKIRVTNVAGNNGEIRYAKSNQREMTGIMGQESGKWLS
jgi:hypothetical protein